MVAAMQIFSSGLRNLDRIELAHRAMNHAENLMSEILSDETVRQPADLSGNLDEEFSYTAVVDYWEEEKPQFSIEVATLPIYLLSVQVEVNSKNDPYGKVYRTVSLKAISEQLVASEIPADTIQQLFGTR